MRSKENASPFLNDHGDDHEDNTTGLFSELQLSGYVHA